MSSHRVDSAVRVDRMHVTPPVPASARGPESGGQVESADGQAPRSGAAPSVASSRRAAGQRDLRNSRIALLLVLLIGVGLLGLHIHSYRQLSVYDEVQHVDYVYRLLNGELPASGERWRPETIDAVTCRHIDYPADYPPCHAAVSGAALPNSGFTTAFIHTPAYYVLPAGAVWITAHLAGSLDQISVMRATGALWLVAAIVLLWLFWRDMHVPWQVRTGLALILVATPTILLAHGTVTNDSTGLAAGAAVMLATLRWDQGRSRLWLPVVVVFAALLFKATSLAVALAACAYVLVRHLQRTTADGRSWWWPLPRPALVFVGCFAAAAAVAGVGWSIFERSQAIMDERLIPQNLTLAADRFDISWLPASMTSFMSPLAPQFLQAALVGQTGAFVGALANVGLPSLAVVGAVRSQAGTAIRALAIATGAALLTFGPLLQVINYVTQHVHFGLPARYGLALVAPMLVIAGTAVRTRRGGYALIALGLICCAGIAAKLVL